MPAENPFARTELLLGREAMEILAKSRVLQFGIGGVGGHCAEALARCGVGSFYLVDGDRVSLTNLNRQAVAFHSTLGEYKVEVMRQRILDINPGASVSVLPAFYRAGEESEIWLRPFDLVIDAIDMVTAKVAIAAEAQAHGIPCLSCMGAANKLDPTRFEAADLYDTSICPLCRATRKLARDKGIERLRVVYSKEEPVARAEEGLAKGERPVPGSIAFVTASAGLVLALEAVRMLLSSQRQK